MDEYNGLGAYLLCNVLLQAAQPLLCSLQNIIVLADSEAEIIFSDMGIGIGVELRRWNGSDANLVNQEPTELEVTGTVGHNGWEGIVRWQLDRCHVGQDKVSTFRLGVLLRDN
jgi:hypothetical protein